MSKMLSGLGRVFVILTDEQNKILRRSVLIVDNGYYPQEHLRSVVAETQRRIPASEVAILSFEHRRGYLQENFPDIKAVFPGKWIRPQRYSLAIKLLILSRRGYDFVVVMSLDKTPIIVALLFMNAQLFLYNRWNEWYLLRFRNPWEFLTFREGQDIAKYRSRNSRFINLFLFIPRLILHVLVFIYLASYSLFLLFYRLYNIIKIRLLKK
ncbi:MAG: hypothetical protein PHI59_07015 [Candidatus Omnitrophica bacterium]|nr:hypothetical protein [Candidatus Omnitrophota bacterium]